MADLLGDMTRFWWVVVIWVGISTATYGVQLWGPTILSQLLKIAPHAAAGYFVYVAISIPFSIPRGIFSRKTWCQTCRDLPMSMPRPIGTTAANCNISSNMSRSRMVCRHWRWGSTISNARRRY